MILPISPVRRRKKIADRPGWRGLAQTVDQEKKLILSEEETLSQKHKEIEVMRMKQRTVFLKKA